MKKKTLSMIIVSGLLTGMLAFSVYAATGTASASSTEASMKVTSSEKGRVEAYATIGNALGWARDDKDLKDSYGTEAYVSDSQLNLTDGGPATSSRARGWFNNVSLDEAYWTD